MPPKNNNKKRGQGSDSNPISSYVAPGTSSKARNAPVVKNQMLKLDQDFYAEGLNLRQEIRPLLDGLLMEGSLQKLDVSGAEEVIVVPSNPRFSVRNEFGMICTVDSETGVHVNHCVALACMGFPKAGRTRCAEHMDLDLNIYVLPAMQHDSDMRKMSEDFSAKVTPPSSEELITSRKKGGQSENLEMEDSCSPLSPGYRKKVCPTVSSEGSDEQPSSAGGSDELMDIEHFKPPSDDMFSDILTQAM